MKSTKVFAVWVLVLVSACTLNAEILSGSFEDPNMFLDPNCPWDANGREPLIVSDFSADDKDNNHITILPVDGNSFVLLRTAGGSPTSDYTEITQIIDVNEGDTLSGVYFFSTKDWMPSWNDAANIYLSLYDPASPGPNPPSTNLRNPEPTKDHLYYDIEIPLVYHDVNSIVVYGGRPGGAMAGWKQFSYTFKPGESGTYRMVIRVADAIDNSYESSLAVDDLVISPAPPDPWCNYKLIGDLNRDCKVDLADFAMMSENWLIDCNLDPGSPACTEL